MKTDWHRRPDNWPAYLQFTTALLCLLPPFACIVANLNVLGLICALAAFGFWCWLGRNTRGFPLLFDLLGMQVLLGSSIMAVVAVVRIIQYLFA